MPQSDVAERHRQLGPIRPRPGRLYEPIARGEQVVQVADVRETDDYRNDPATFLDACHLSVPTPSLLLASRNLHTSGHPDGLTFGSAAIPWYVVGLQISDAELLHPAHRLPGTRPSDPCDYSGAEHRDQVPPSH